MAHSPSYVLGGFCFSSLEASVRAVAQASPALMLAVAGQATKPSVLLLVVETEFHYVALAGLEHLEI